MGPRLGTVAYSVRAQKSNNKSRSGSEPQQDWHDGRCVVWTKTEGEVPRCRIVLGYRKSQRPRHRDPPLSSTVELKVKGSSSVGVHPTRGECCRQILNTCPSVNRGRLLVCARVGLLVLWFALSCFISLHAMPTPMRMRCCITLIFGYLIRAWGSGLARPAPAGSRQSLGRPCSCLAGVSPP